MLTSTPSPRMTSEAAPIARVRVGADPTQAGSEPKIGYYSVYDVVAPVAGGIAGYFVGSRLGESAAEDDWMMKPWFWSVMGVGAGIWLRRESIAAGLQRWKDSQKPPKTNG